MIIEKLEYNCHRVRARWLPTERTRRHVFRNIVSQCDANEKSARESESSRELFAAVKIFGSPKERKEDLRVCSCNYFAASEGEKRYSISTECTFRCWQSNPRVPFDSTPRTHGIRNTYSCYATSPTTRSRPRCCSKPWRRPSCCGWCTVRRCACGDRPWTRCWWSSNRGPGGTRGPRVAAWTAWRWWWSTSICAACRTPLLLADWDSLSDMSRTPPWTPAIREKSCRHLRDAATLIADWLRKLSHTSQRYIWKYTHCDTRRIEEKKEKKETLFDFTRVTRANDLLQTARTRSE